MPTTTYTIRESNGYVIHDQPDQSEPIRRLIKEGGEVLSVAELLGVAIGPVPGLEASLKEYGSGTLKGLHSVSDICETLKIDQVQATRLLAIMSLGKRLYEPSQGSLTVIRDAQDAYVYCRTMANLPREQLKVLLLNSRYQVVHEEVLAIGSAEHLQVLPRDVFQAAVERRVPAIILVHNHPSDDSKPSKSDREFTKTVQEAGRLLGIELLDHVIVTRDTYASVLTS